jgi:hypothetical protein
MDGLHELEKKHEHLVGRFEELKEQGLKGFQAQINTMQDRMNRQELYIKELLLTSHQDRLNAKDDRLSFVQSLNNLETSITKSVTDSLKTIEQAYKQDKEKQSGFNNLVSQRMAQGVLIVAILWYMAKDLIGGGG